VRHVEGEFSCLSFKENKQDAMQPHAKFCKFNAEFVALALRPVFRKEYDISETGDITARMPSISDAVVTFHPTKDTIKLSNFPSCHKESDARCNITWPVLVTWKNDVRGRIIS
jgi:hypothetical protein